MSDSAIGCICLVAAAASIVGALRCLADHLLVSASIYTVLAVTLLGGAAKALIDTI